MPVCASKSTQAVLNELLQMILNSNVADFCYRLLNHVECNLIQLRQSVFLSSR